MQLREYKTSDAKALYELFYQTVHSVNAHDYTEDQLNVWATGTVDIHKWNESFVKHKTVVATEGTTIVGFGDIDDTGYLDRLFVHKDYQRQGIASAICDRLESSVSATLISTQASITARPFFEKRGYLVIKRQQVQRNGFFLTNYLMEKDLLKTENS